jgi:SAM-dependent methyltransferase
MSATTTGVSEHLREKVEQLAWYHTIEIVPGLTTKGWFDLRDHVRHYRLREDMTGMRVLDIGTWDGFWAFEMERRGADVVALDVDHEREYDWPPRRRPKELKGLDRGAGFRLVKEICGSKVERVQCNIYDIDPEKLGTFDLVFCGVVLIHQRDQLLALERFASVCHGRLIIAEEYDRLSGFVPFPVSRYHADRDLAVVFWLPSKRTWKRMVWTAGFDDVEEKGTFTVTIKSTAGKTRAIPHVVIHAKGAAAQR